MTLALAGQIRSALPALDGAKLGLGLSLLTEGSYVWLDAVLKTVNSAASILLT